MTTAAIPKSMRTLGRLRDLEHNQLLESDFCPICRKNNIIRRLWRQDFFCGWCQAVFRIIGETLHHLGFQPDLK